MDRKSQIFAPTAKIAGARKPVKQQATQPSCNLKTILDTMKGEVAPTILRSCSFKSGDDITSIDNPKIQSITKNRKHVCFVVTGESRVVGQKEALDALPADFEKVIKENLNNRSEENLD